MAQNGRKWQDMALNGTKWLNMAANGTKWDSRVTKFVNANMFRYDLQTRNVNNWFKFEDNP